MPNIVLQSESLGCAECGRRLPPQWPSGLCPACLLGGGDGERRSRLECPDFTERYEFLDAEPRARGGMGLVYRVRDRRLRREVALKLPAGAAAASETARQRFLWEAQIASQLNHGGFLPIFDFGLDPRGHPFYTTTLLSGQTLARLLEQEGRQLRSEPVRRRLLGLFERVCGIVASAHRRGVLHRDLKPQNILLGEGDQPFIIDFGSAVVVPPVPEEPGGTADAGPVHTTLPVLEDDPGSAPTQATPMSVPRTTLYTPPEVLRHPDLPPGPQEDVYALGVVLHEIGTGRLPYGRELAGFPADRVLREERLRALILDETVSPFAELESGVPRDLAAICRKALARDPGRRYPRVAELARDVRAFLDTRVVQATDPGPWDRLRKWALRHSRHLAWGMFALTVMGGALGVAAFFGVKHRHAEQVVALRDAQLNQEQQWAALRDAQLASRQGDWRGALVHLDRAERAGYPDTIELGLHRIAAWTAVSEYGRIRTELDRLLALDDLGPHRGAVLLRLGEHQLFQEHRSAEGVASIRAALAAGLDRADACIARGFLAPTTPEALAWLRQAIVFDPYSPMAHQHATGLESLLGSEEQLRPRIEWHRLLFPEDPTPLVLAAQRLALAGDLSRALEVAAPLQAVLPPLAWERCLASLRLESFAPTVFDLESFAGGTWWPRMKTNHVLADAAALLAGGDFGQGLTNQPHLTIPPLPCLQAGLEKSARGVLALTAAGALGLYSERAVEAILEGSRIHPEALLPTTAAMVSDLVRPTEPARLARFLRNQVRLLERGLAAPPLVPNAHRLARFLMAGVQRDLSRLPGAASADARQAAGEQLRWFLRETPRSVFECQRLYAIARDLDAHELARDFLRRWESLQPGAPGLLRRRAEIEMADRNYPAVLELVAPLVSQDLHHDWAQPVQDEAREAMRRLLAPGPQSAVTR